MGRILIVDDEEAVASGLARLLLNAGYDVAFATTLEDGKRLADEQETDLLVVDIRLGPYNGLQLALREHLRHPRLPIIATTGYPDAVLEREARAYGAEFLEKPFDIAQFMQLVGRLLPRSTKEAAAEGSSNSTVAL